MLPKYRWEEPQVSGASVEALAGALDLPPPVARLLAARGVTSPAAAAAFLNPDLKACLSAPFLFPGARQAAERLWDAIRNGRGIVVFGDFDADGVAAAAILSTALQRLGGSVEVFLPAREPEGYGLTFAALERCLGARQTPPGLLVTVDCGIGSVAEVAHLNSLGVEVIVTDHHEPGPALPPASVIVNPRLGASPGAEHLCGAGVAFKVAHALVELGRENGWYGGGPLGGELLVPAGLATVADVVPLTGENRLLVWSALKHWGRFAGAGLRALLSRAAQEAIPAPDAHTFGFILGPRINAAGRMASAMVAYELLITRDRDRAAALAAQLEGLNGQRKGVEERIVLAARRQCGLEADGGFAEAAVVVGEAGSHAGAAGWHPGVIGIVASRLSDATGRPAAVVAFDEGGAGRGSVRAGEGYHALEALAAAGETLEGFGGHAKAAGFRVKPGAFGQFKRLFTAACAAQAQVTGGARTLTVDGWLAPQEVTEELYEAQQRLAPFGHGNPAPRWGLRGVTVADAKPMGAAGAHLQLAFKRDGAPLPRGVWFRHGGVTEALRAHGGLFDVVFELRENTFGGETAVELQVVDLAPHLI